MKVKSSLIVVLAFLLINPTGLLAESVSEIDQEMAVVEGDNHKLSENLNQVIEEANSTYREVEKIKTKLTNAKTEQAENEKAIAETTELIENRKELMAEQMREIQTNPIASSTLSAILSSDGISDFIRKSMALSTIRKAQNDKVSELTKAEKNLKALVEEKEAIKNDLETAKANLEAKSTALNSQVENLKHKVAENQSVIENLSNSKIAEKKRLADEAKAMVAAANNSSNSNADNNSQSDNTNTNTTTDNGSNNNNNNNDNSNNNDNNGGSVGGGDSGSANSGNQLQVVSTAYSYQQPGMGYITAIGIDLRSQSNVIAVDPSVIPLGRLVEVSGYGYAIAGDTGGDIKGNRIDVHFSTVAQCVNWGRRNATVTVLG